MLFCSILLSFCVFFVLQVFGRKESMLEIEGLMDKNLEKLEADEEGAGVCESDRAQETVCSSAQGKDRMQLCSRAKEGDRL
jgi:hypothetical protein